MNADDRRLLDEILSEYDPDFSKRESAAPISKSKSQTSAPAPRTPAPSLSPPVSPEGFPRQEKPTDRSRAVDFLLPPPDPDRDHTIHVNRQSVCEFDILVPLALKLPEVFSCRLTSLPGSSAEALLGYGFHVSVNHVQGSDADFSGDGVTSADMAVEEELMHPVFHAPRFGGGGGSETDEPKAELYPFQAVIDLPLTSANWASPAKKGAAPTTIRVYIDNSKSLFRPRRLLFQYAFCTTKIKETALEAARDIRSREVGARNEKNFKIIKEGAKVLGGLVIGGVVSGAGIGALAGGAVVVGGMKAMEKLSTTTIKNKMDGSGGEADKEGEEGDVVEEIEEKLEEKEEELDDEADADKIEELNNRLSEQALASENDKKSWEKEREMLVAKEEEAMKQAQGLASRTEELQDQLESERKSAAQREDDLLQSVVELEGIVKRLKKEKKVLVNAVRQKQLEQQQLALSLKAEMHEKRLAVGGAREEEYLSQLKERRKQLETQAGGAGKNEDVASLIKELSAAIESLERRRG
mmetsp:Transcript_11843/g.23963  ORF Transcript_11843/g.23963 Transcript_11843/m.23963 type:complete len:525 (+) Transcript_11843:36-1610(+)